MAVELTPLAKSALDRVVIEPQLVLDIDGVDTLYGLRDVKSVIKIGSPEMIIGEFIIGEFIKLSNSETLISLDGTTTTIGQQLEIDKARGSSIDAMSIALVDKNNEITDLITPGNVVADVLGRKCKVWMGFAEGTSWKQDFFILFRGTISEISSLAGLIIFNIDSPEQKKRSEIYTKVSTELNGAINSTVTTVTLDSTSDILIPITGPGGGIDTAFESYVRIDDEVMQFTGISGFDLTGVMRGSLGTTAAAHDDEAGVDTFYRLQGDAMHLALKILMSGFDGPYIEDEEIDNFVSIGGANTVANSIFFSELNVEQEFGVFVGDFITTTGASNGANNVTLKTVSDVVIIEGGGSYIVVDGVSFVEESDTAAVIDFRSQFDVLPDGLKMGGDEVDVAQFDRIFRLFLSSFDYDIYLKDTIENGKDFIEKELYKPAACFTVPRKGRTSVNIHAAPIPSVESVTIDIKNIKNPDSLKLRRSISKNFFNRIVYQFDETVLEERFTQGHIEFSAVSQAQIENAGKKSLPIVSKGLRAVLSGSNLAQQSAARRLDRYKFGAEFIDGIQLLFKDAFQMEIGDIIILDPSELEMSNTKSGGGDRNKDPILVEIVNKKVDITGKATINIIDTNFDGQDRYGLIGPSSKVKVGTSTTVFEIKPSFNTDSTGSNEFQKWQDIITPSKDLFVRVRNSDFSNNDTAQVQSFNGNIVTLATALSFTPSADDIMELADYNQTNSIISLLYGYMTDAATFDDGTSQFVLL